MKFLKDLLTIIKGLLTTSLITSLAISYIRDFIRYLIKLICNLARKPLNSKPPDVKAITPKPPDEILNSREHHNNSLETKGKNVICERKIEIRFGPLRFSISHDYSHFTF